MVGPDDQLRAEWLSEVVSLCQSLGSVVVHDAPSVVIQRVEATVDACPRPRTVTERLTLRCLLLELYLQVISRVARIPGAEPQLNRSCRFWAGDNRLADPLVPFRAATTSLLRIADDASDRPVHDRARKWLDAHWAERAPLKRVGAELHADRRTVARHFRTALGMTMKQYCQQLQSTRAIQLLRETDIKIEAIALLVGCKSKATFYRLIRRATGHRPADIRRLARVSHP